MQHAVLPPLIPNSELRIPNYNWVRVSRPQFLALPKHHFAHSANIISLSGYIICLQGQHHSALFERCLSSSLLPCSCSAGQSLSKKQKAKLEMKGKCSGIQKINQVK